MLIPKVMAEATWKDPLLIPVYPFPKLPGRFESDHPTRIKLQVLAGRRVSAPSWWFFFYTKFTESWNKYVFPTFKVWFYYLKQSLDDFSWSFLCIAYLLDLSLYIVFCKRHLLFPVLRYIYCEELAISGYLNNPFSPLKFRFMSQVTFKLTFTVVSGTGAAAELTSVTGAWDSSVLGVWRFSKFSKI